MNALYKHIIKANQAYIEVRHRRTQIDSLQSVLYRKNIVIQNLLDANKLATDRNQDYLEVFKAQQVKIRGCEELEKKYEFANKRLKIRGTFMQVGTPIIVVSVGVLCGVGGYYLKKYVLP